MRFMMLVIPKGYETAEPGTMPDAVKEKIGDFDLGGAETRGKGRKA
jgi:hypothetical protein